MASFGSAGRRIKASVAVAIASTAAAIVSASGDWNVSGGNGK